MSMNTVSFMECKKHGLLSRRSFTTKELKDHMQICEDVIEYITPYIFVWCGDFEKVAYCLAKGYKEITRVMRSYESSRPEQYIVYDTSTGEHNEE